MKILLITGRLARRAVEEAVARAKARGTRHLIDIEVLPIDVMSILTVEQLLYFMEKYIGLEKLKEYDLIMVPGLIRGSTKVIEKAVGVKTVKGTVHASMIDELLLLSDEELSMLSTELPADLVLRIQAIENAIEISRKVETKVCRGIFVKNKGMCIASRPPPQRIIAVVPISLNEPAFEDAIERACLADIVGISVDIPKDPEDVVKALKKVDSLCSSKPIAIDCFNISILRRALEHVDIVLNVYPSLLTKLRDAIDRDTVINVIAVDPERNLYPQIAEEKVRIGLHNVDEIRKLGFDNIVLDLILEPPLKGLYTSLRAYSIARDITDIPLQMNLSNVVEFVDADSIGISAMLTFLAFELGVSTLLVYEMEGRSYGITREVAMARDMAMIAHARNTTPRSLGIDLFVAKEPKHIDIDIVGNLKPEIIEVEPRAIEPRPDPRGFFKIRVDRYGKRIEVLYIGSRGVLLFRGRRAWDILSEIIARDLVSQPLHIAYLGYELAKAEIALRLGRSYVQDEDMFKSFNLDLGVER